MDLRRSLVLSMVGLVLCAAPATAIPGLADYDADGPGGTPEPAHGLVITRRGRFLTGRSARSPAAIAADYVRSHRVRLGFDGAPPAPRVVTSPDGITHVTYTPAVDGIPAANDYVRVNLARGGRVLDVVGTPVADLTVAGTRPAVGRSDAGSILRAAAGGGDATVADLRLAIEGDRLAWRADVTGADGLLYDVLVDARTGEILRRSLLTDFLDEALVYDAFPSPALTPATITFGGGGKGGDPSWIDDTASRTRLWGNNVRAYADVSAPDGDQGEDIAATGGDWKYPFAFTGGCANCVGSDASNNKATTTQLFYYVNHFHDHLKAAPIGFDQASGNFERIQAPGAGTGGDPINAEADDYAGTNNATFSIPAVDGTPPKMQLFPTSINGRASQTAVDATAVYHEFAHGMIHRLVAPGVLDNAQSEAIDEGEADWYALDLLVGEGSLPDPEGSGDVFVGNSLTGPKGFFGDATTDRPGFRQQAMDCAVGAAAADCPAPATGTAGSGGFTFGDLGKIGASNKNNNGEIWAQTLWDLRTAVGADAARALITGALRISPSNPTFLQMRDAILQTALATGRPRAPIWAVFAARGMGAQAQGNDSNTLIVTEDFSVPAALRYDSSTVTDPPPLGDGDGVAEPGETVSVVTRLRNDSDGVVAGATGHLTSAAVVGQADSSWASFPVGGVVGNDPPFRVTIPADQPCGTALPVSLQAAGQTVPPTKIPVGAPVFTASTDAGLPRAIPDNDNTGIKSSLDAALPGDTVRHLTVRIGSLPHTAVGDLTILIRHDPGPTTVTLTARPGSPGFSADNLSDLVFDDGADRPIESAVGSGPITGAYKPDSPLSAFDGQPTSGTWRLLVTDGAASNTGSLVSWGLSAAPVCDTAVPVLPIAVTGDATDITATTADLHGTVDANGTDTATAFEYGPTTDYGSRTTPVSAGAGADPVAVGTTLSGLAPGTAVHVRTLALRSGEVVARGEDRTFTPGPVPTPPAGTPTPTPTTVAGDRRVKRTVTFAYRAKRRRVTGRVRPRGACSAKAKVTVRRLKKGKDPRIARVTTNGAGRFAKHRRLKPGRYYVTVATRKVASLGTCTAARSKAKRVRR